MVRTANASGFARATMMIVMALVVTAPAACNVQSDDDKTLVVAVDQTIDGLNPLTSFFALNDEVNNLVYTPLIQWSAKDFTPQPGLASHWSSSKDDLTWTYTIRDDVSWSDGEQVTARDAAFTYQMLMDDKDLHAAHAELVDNFKSVSAPNDTTLVIKIKKPTSQMTSLSQPVVPKHVWKDIDKPADFANTDTPMVGSGPFVVSDFAVDEYIKFAVNDDYFGGAAAYDELVFQYYKTPDAAVQALHSGDVDLVGGLNPAQFTSLKNQDDIEVNDASTRHFTSITFNVGAKAKDGTTIGDGNPALRDSAVRQALHRAVDKDELVSKIEDGLAEPGVGYIPPLYDDYFWDPGDKAVRFDIDEANHMLDKAGYRRGDDGIRTMPHSDKQLKLRLLYHSDESSYATIADFLSGWWEQLGIDIDLDSADSTKVNDKLYAGNYDIIFSGWGVDADPTQILSLYTCDALPRTAHSSERNTDTFYCNDDFDKLFAQQKGETDPAKRAQLIKKMQEMLYNQAPEITLYYAHSLEAYRSDRWSGFQTQPGHDGVIRMQQGMWGYYSATPQTSAVSGTSVVTWSIAAIVVIAGLIMVVWWRRRRHATQDERE